MHPSRLAAIAEYYSDEFARAGSLYAAPRERVIDRGEDGHLPILDADLSMVERVRGNLPRALEIANGGCEIAQMLGSHTALADMLCERSHVRVTLGDEAGAREDAERADARTTDDANTTFWLASARASRRPGRSRPDQQAHRRDAVHSTKTVEANLARIYLKLGIRSRAELGVAMAHRNERESSSARIG